MPREVMGCGARGSGSTQGGQESSGRDVSLSWQLPLP